MVTSPPPILIDLNQFKLHLSLPDQKVLSLHFDTPSRKFYLSVIAFVVEQMKKNGTSVPMEEQVREKRCRGMSLKKALRVMRVMLKRESGNRNYPLNLFR